MISISEQQIDSIRELHGRHCQLHLGKKCPLVQAYKDLEITRHPESGIQVLTGEEARKLIEWLGKL